MPTDFVGSLAARIFSPGRMAKYIRGLLTGYGSLGVALVFTAVTVPMGISSLGLAGWGIWVFCQQASAAICLFESFTQSAFVRLLIQVKDDPSSESYKKMVWMGRACFWGQGLLLFILHVGFAAVLPALFPNVGGSSGWETVWLMGLAALVNQAGKINGQLLFAHQHQDRASLAATAGLLVNLGIVVACLPRFPHPQTMAWAFLGGTIFSQGLYWVFAFQTGCRPSFPGRPRIRWPDFQPLWFWGRQFFLFSLFNNLSNNLPTLLAGRFLSLEMVGVWGVLQRIANMMSQAVLKIPQVAVPALMEMHARGEEPLFYKRSRQILCIQNVLAGLALGAFAVGGDSFLATWLGKPMPMPVWVLPIFTLTLLADFDQRLRFDLETLRLLVRRPTMAALLKIILILLAVPPLSHFYGLTGMTLALGATYGLVLLPWSLTKTGRTESYILPTTGTLAGLAAYLLTAGLGWLLKLWIP